MANPTSSPYIEYQLGEGMLRVKRMALAIEIFEGLTEKNPSDFRPHVQLAAIYLEKQKPAEALGALKKSVAVGKDKARQMISTDPRFEPIRNTVDYVKLIYPGRPTTPQTGLPSTTGPNPGIRSVIPRSVLPPGQK